MATLHTDPGKFTNRGVYAACSCFIAQITYELKMKHGSEAAPNCEITIPGFLLVEI